jgi:hypothetical protein
VLGRWADVTLHNSNRAVPEDSSQGLRGLPFVGFRGAADDVCQTVDAFFGPLLFGYAFSFPLLSVLEALIAMRRRSSADRFAALV